MNFEALCSVLIHRTVPEWARITTVSVRMLEFVNFTPSSMEPGVTPVAAKITSPDASWSISNFPSKSLTPIFAARAFWLLQAWPWMLLWTRACRIRQAWRSILFAARACWSFQAWPDMLLGALKCRIRQAGRLILSGAWACKPSPCQQANAGTRRVEYTLSSCSRRE